MAAVLLNITGEPSRMWSNRKRLAALQLGTDIIGVPFHRIVDVPFPEIPPRESLEGVRTIVDMVASRVPQDAAAAVVEGDPIAVVLLVDRLQRRGIHCYAATTERIVEVTEDGRRSVEVRFVRFRQYPGNPADDWDRDE